MFRTVDLYWVDLFLALWETFLAEHHLLHAIVTPADMRPMEPLRAYLRCADDAFNPLSAGRC